MAPEVFKHRKYDKKVDVFSFGMILYEVMLVAEWKEIRSEHYILVWYTNPQLVQMLEGDPPLSNYEPYEAAKYVAEGHRPFFRSKGLITELKE